MEKTSPPPADPLMAHGGGSDRSEKRARTICWCAIVFRNVILLNTKPEDIWCLHLQVLWLIPKHQGGAHAQMQAFISAADAVWQVQWGFLGFHLSASSRADDGCETRRRKGPEVKWEVRRKWVRTTVTRASVTLTPPEQSPAYLLFSWCLFLFMAEETGSYSQSCPPHCSPAHAIATNTRFAIGSRCMHMPPWRTHTLSHSAGSWGS